MLAPEETVEEQGVALAVLDPHENVWFAQMLNQPWTVRSKVTNPKTGLSREQVLPFSSLEKFLKIGGWLSKPVRGPLLAPSSIDDYLQRSPFAEEQFFWKLLRAECAPRLKDATMYTDPYRIMVPTVWPWSLPMEEKQRILSLVGYIHHSCYEEHLQAVKSLLRVARISH